MTVVNPQTIKKAGVVVIGLALVLALRWETLYASIWVNRGLVAFQQYPTWRVIADDKVPDAIVQTTSFLQQVAEHSREDDIALTRVYGLLLFVQGRQDKAVAVWRSAGLHPAQVIAFQGNYAQSINRNDVALVWYEKTVDLDPELALA